MPYRVGIGYDIHRLVKERALYLGGIQIPFEKGLLGHSDADVLLHAVSDALLGAAGLGDIGEHFPDTDARYKNIASRELLQLVVELIKKKGFKIFNIDAVIIAEAPKITPFKKQIQLKISQILQIDESCINVKAKTNEGIGEIGRKEAIAAYAVAILIKGERG